MSYKRVVRKEGKEYGPYIYESYRDKNGNVKKRYIGKKEKPIFSLKIFFVVLLFLLLVAGIYSFYSADRNKSIVEQPASAASYAGNAVLAMQKSFGRIYSFFSPKLTGHAYLDIDRIFSLNSFLSGTLMIKIKSGELIPADSKIIVEQPGLELKEFELSDFVKMNSEGAYFVEQKQGYGNPISGYGEGYGFPGKKTVYPEVSFVLKVYDKEENEENEASSELSNESGEESSTTEIPAEENEEQGLEITADAINEIRELVDGKVSAENNFEYPLDEGESAEIVSGSIVAGNKTLPDSTVILKIEDNKATATTEYYESTEGFGKDYLEDDEHIIDISLSNLKIAAINGTIRVKLVYNGELLAQSEKEVSPGGELLDVDENKIIGNESFAESRADKNIQAKKARIIVGKPVKWVKTISVESGQNLEVEIPKSAENIAVKTGEEALQAEKIIEQEQQEIQEDKKALITGKVSLEIVEQKGILSSFFSWIRLRITGKIISEQDIQEAISETDDAKIVDLTLIAQDSGATDIAIEYYTEAPTAEEEEIAGGKRVVISAPSELEYADVLAYSELDNKIKLSEKNKIRVYHVADGNKELVDFDAYDLDLDGNIDYIEWNVPHLSEQVYEIIYITKAVKLDSSRNFVEDVYDLVKARDNNFADVSSGEYVRVTFEQKLDNTRDITIYAKSSTSQPASIEVYEQDDNEIIATFNNINSENWYKVYLTNLEEGESYDIFDLKVLGDAEIDYIVDPLCYKEFRCCIDLGECPVGTLLFSTGDGSRQDICAETSKRSADYWSNALATCQGAYIGGYLCPQSFYEDMLNTQWCSDNMVFGGTNNEEWRNDTENGRVDAISSCLSTPNYDVCAEYPPDISINYPTEGGIVNEDQWAANFSYSYDNSVTCEYSWDNYDYTQFSSCGATDSIVPLEGENTLYIKGTDSDENTGEGSVSFTYDSEVPVIESISPEDGAYYTNEDVEISAEISDDNLDSAWINFSNTIYIMDCEGDLCSYIVLGQSDGSYSYTVYANDSAGNHADSEGRTVNVDAHAPTLSEVSPVSSPTSDNTPSYEFSTDEDGSGECGGSCSGYCSEISSVTAGDVSFNFSTLPDGTYSDCTITITDAAENPSDPLSVSEFVIDTQNPAISITIPESKIYMYAVSELNYSVSDNNLDSCWYSIDFGENLTITCGENVTGLIPNGGSNTWIVYANDSLGHENSSSVTFYYDNTAPAVHLISPANNTAIASVSQNSQNFSCNITDETAISNLTFYIWNSTGSLNYQNTTLLSGTSNSSNWIYVLPYSGNFKWNCLGYDSAGNNDWGAEGNYTITLPPNNPPNEPTLNSPGNYSTGNSLSTLLNVSVTDIDNDLMNVSFWSQFKTISSGNTHTCGILSNGTAMCWGSANGYGQIGDGSQLQRLNPVFVNTSNTFVSISAGSSHTCGILSNGTAMCWGNNAEGELGDGSTTNRLSPVFVNTSNTFISISAGGNSGTVTYHTCGILSNGTAMCWGNNDYGQLGDGSTTQSLNPVFVNTSNTFISISAGGIHTCGILSNGTAMCWGNNAEGELGDGSVTQSLNPVYVNTDNKFISLSAGGDFHTCGILSNGTAMCWGYNNYGQLGDGTKNTDRTSPVFVNTDNKFISISSGNVHTCGILLNGTAMCWGGSDGSAYIGDGASLQRLSPVYVNTSNLFVSISSGNVHTCGILSNGTAMCWGTNAGRLGDGTVTTKFSPVFVNTSNTFKSPVIGSSENIANGSSASVSWAGLTGLATYLWSVVVADSNKGYAISPIWQFTTMNTVLPLTIVSPLAQSYNVSSMSFDISSTNSSNNLSFCRLSLNNWATNYTMTINSSKTGAGYINSSIGDESYTAKFYCNDTSGNLSSIVQISFTIDTSPPLISYGIGTENNNEIISNLSGIYVNVSLIEASLANITFSLYTSAGAEVNSTTFTSAVYTINWTNLAPGNYKYQVNASDSVGNKNSTSLRNITLLPSCLSQCSELADCNITSSCYLYSELCNNSICGFRNFKINSSLYTLYSGMNGNNLNLNLSGNISFIGTSAYFIFSGKNGSSASAGSLGGNAGIINISVPNLFNTTNARFVGLGGYSTISGAGGNGGVLSLSYRGLFGLINSLQNRVKVTAGSSTNSTAGTGGSIVYNKNIYCSSAASIYRDVDINGDGVVDLEDVDLIQQLYGNVTGDSTFNETYDISCDGKINVVEIAREGFEYDRGS